MSEVKLSLVMIVKNEALGLEKCLLSAKPFVDEIIIAIDDQTTDDSAKIAAKYADVVKYFKWEDDFSKARNDIGVYARGKWTMFLDGHEYISECSGLAEKLESAADGLMCVIEMENGMRFNNPRIFKTGTKFVGAVHEKQQCQALEFFPGLIIRHDRLEGQEPEAAAERKKQRDEMTPRIMLEQYRLNKKCVRASFHLGMHYHGRGKLGKAKMWFRRYLKYAEVPGERWFVFFQLATMCLIKKKLFRAMWYAERAEDETPGRWEIQKLKGLIYFERKYYSEAVECLVNSFSKNRGIPDYSPWAPDIAGTWNCIGEAFFRSNCFEKAKTAFEAAAEAAQDPILKKFLSSRAALMGNLTGLK